MRVRYKGKTDFLVLTHNHIYDVISVERDWYRIKDDSGENYLYAREMFDVVSDKSKDCA